MVVLAQTPYQNKRGKWGYTLHNKKFIRPQYGYATPFKNGIARVCSTYDKWGVIDTRADYIVWPKYDKISEFTYTYNGTGYAIVTEGDKMGVIDNKGKEVLPLKGHLYISDIKVIDKGPYSVYLLQDTKKRYKAVVVDKRKSTVKEHSHGFTHLEIHHKFGNYFMIGYRGGEHWIMPMHEVKKRNRNLSSDHFADHRTWSTDPTQTTIMFNGEKPFYVAKHREHNYYCYIDARNFVVYDIDDFKNKLSFSDKRVDFEENNLYYPTPIKSTKSSDAYYEENINGNIYMHPKTKQSIIEKGIELHFIKHYIDKKDYIYIKKEDVLHKIAMEDIEGFLPPLTGSNARRKMWSVDILPNGDILFEVCGIIREYVYNSEIIYPPQYKMILGNLVCIDPGGIHVDEQVETQIDVVILDGKTFKPKYTDVLPNGRQIDSMSKLGGFYLGYRNSISNGGDIIKYSNDCNPVWVYSLKEGEKINTLYETSQYVFLLGSTTNEGYVGRDNPMLVCLDRKFGILKTKYVAKIDNRGYKCVGVENGIAYAKLSNSTESYRIPIFSLAKLEPVAEPFSIVVDTSYGFASCGLIDAFGKWCIYPVILGEKPVTHGEWTIYPPSLSIEGKKRIVIGKDGICRIYGTETKEGKFDKHIVIEKDGKYGLYDTETNSWARQCNANSIKELY